MPRKILAGYSEFCLGLPLDQHRERFIVSHKSQCPKDEKESVVCCNTHCPSFETGEVFPQELRVKIVLSDKVSQAA